MAELDLDLFPDPVLIVDRNRCLTGWNAAATDLLGPLDSIRTPIGEAFDVQASTGLPDFRDGWPGPGEQTKWSFARPSDGRRVAVSVAATLLGLSKQPDGAVLVTRPVAETDGIAIVAAVSHELRSPLTSIKGYTSLLLGRWDTTSDDQKRQMLEAVLHDADRVTRLVTELLDISRLETGRLVLRLREVDLGQLIAAVVEKLAMAYPDLECDFEFADPFPLVVADPDKVEQVFTNLVENAAKYADPKGIRIVGRVVDDHVLVEVHDRGEGIRSEDLPRVFTKFFRGDHGKPSGTGLGLWISRGLAEAHGGTLDAVSEPGTGSDFVLSLPLVVEESTGPLGSP